VVEGHQDHNLARPVRKPRQRRACRVDPVPPELVERVRADFLARDDPASALIVCLLAYARLRTLNEISELQRRDVGRKVLRVNARKTHRMRTADILPPHETDLRPSIAALADKPIGAPVMPRFDGTALTEGDWRTWRRRIYAIQNCAPPVD
jgi:hypothetical protein